jgi:hypothetical protein
LSDEAKRFGLRGKHRFHFEKMGNAGLFMTMVEKHLNYQWCQEKSILVCRDSQDDVQLSGNVG